MSKVATKGWMTKSRKLFSVIEEVLVLFQKCRSSGVLLSVLNDIRLLSIELSASTAANLSTKIRLRVELMMVTPIGL